MWRRSSEHASQEKASGGRRQAFRSSSRRQLRRFKRQGFYRAITAHRRARLIALERVRSFASALTSQGSTGPHLGSSSGRLMSADARVHLIATFACPLAYWARLWHSSTACGTPWRLRRPSIRRSWQIWRCTFRSRTVPRSLPRLRAWAAHEERLQQCAFFATTTPLQ